MDLSSYSQTSSSDDGMDLSSYAATPEKEEIPASEEDSSDLSSFGTTENISKSEITSDTTETVTNTTEVVNSQGSKSLLEIQEMINELIKDDNIKEAEFQRAKAEYMEYKKEFKIKLQELNSQITAIISDTDKSLGN